MSCHLARSILMTLSKSKNKTLHFLMQSQPGPSIFDLECKHILFLLGLSGLCYCDPGACYPGPATHPYVQCQCPLLA